MPRRLLVFSILASLAAATVLGLVNAAHHHSMMIANGYAMPWRHALVMEMPFWYAAALLTPALVAALRHFPDRARGFTKLVEHLVIAIVWIAAQSVLEVTARAILGTGLPGPAPPFVPLVVYSLTRIPTVAIVAYCGVVGAIYALTYYMRLREQETNAANLEARLAEAQLQTLRMQLNPHFLFNAMNTVAMLTRAGRSTESVAMLLSLSALMREVLRADAPLTVSLTEEIAMLERYIQVEQVRFGGNLTVDVAIPDALAQAQVPSFLLQPLVENAIKHGRARSEGIATIAIRAGRSDDDLVLSVWDDGPANRTAPAGDSVGIGLGNIRERLRKAYGARQSFTIGQDASGGTRAEITIPLRSAAVV